MLKIIFLLTYCLNIVFYNFLFADSDNFDNGRNNVEKRPVALKSYETEINLILTELSNLNTLLASLDKVNNNTRFVSKKPFLEESFNFAVEYFYKQDFLSAIREFNIYLNTVQNIDSSKYLKAQYLLALSYESIKEYPKALRAYIRYLASYITHEVNNYSELLDVLHRITKLLSLQKSSANTNFSNILSAIVNLNWSSSQKSMAYFYAAYIAAKIFNIDLAIEWFDKALFYAQDDSLKPKILYFYALCFVVKNNFKEAIKFLETIITEYKTTATPEQIGLTYLALARIHADQKNYEQAFKYYSYIEQNSPYYKDALFETIVVLLKLSKFEQALVAAKTFEEKFNDDEKIFEVKKILTYLEIKSTNTQSILSYLDSMKNELNTLHKWFNSKYKHKSQIHKSDIDDILLVTKNKIPDPPVVITSKELFDKLMYLKQKLFDIKNEINNVLYVVGTYNLEILNPNTVMRAQQITDISQKSLELGHKLIAIERGYKKQYIDDIEWQKLLLLEEQRTKIASSKLLNIKSQMKLWTRWVNLYQLNQNLNDTYEKFNQAKAMLAASQILSLNLSQSQYQKVIENQNTMSQNLNSQILRVLNLLRLKQTLDHIYQSRHNITKDLHITYANLLHEEASILGKYRYHAANASEKIMNQNFEKAWELWEYVSKDLYYHLMSFEKDLKVYQQKMKDNIEKFLNMNEELLQKIQNTNDKLALFLGQKANEITDTYLSIIDDQKAKIQKFKADIEWLSYKQTKENQNKLQTQYEIQKEIFNYEYNDLNKNEVIFKWLE